MPNMSRVGDMGVGRCCCHKSCRSMTGVLIQGSPDVITTNSPQSYIGHIILATCGHTGTMVTGSGNIYINGKPAVRVGDQFTGCFTGSLVQGSPDTIGN